MYGDGIFSRKLDFSNKIKKILNKYGDEKILSIRVGRRPINNMVEKAFNIISIGKWNELRNQYYYDKLFHLFIILTLQDGTKISFEKNDIVNMDVNDSRCSETNVECIELEYPQNSITINELVKKPLERIGKEDYFIYDPFKLNCQIFIKSILETFGLYNSNANNFIYQDISNIIKKLPFYVKWTAKKVTDISSFGKKISGAGNDKKNKDLKEISLFVADIFKDV
jgi:transcriptional antiterminator Rof (Rho-off)